MDSVFVEVGYSGLESVEKNVFDNFLEICKHPFFSEQFQKSICSGSFSAVASCRQFYLKRFPLQGFLDIFQSFRCRYFKMSS